MISEPGQTTGSLADTQAGDRYIAKRVRSAGLIIIAGMSVQGLSLFWNHPLSFLAFLGIGGLAVCAGIVLYLSALVSPRKP